jgi:hypothetical protein
MAQETLGYLCMVIITLCKATQGGDNNSCKNLRDGANLAKFAFAPPESDSHSIRRSNSEFLTANATKEMLMVLMSNVYTVAMSM